mgnify:CR=1 FL=1
MTEKEAREKGLYNVVGKEIDDRYIEELKKCVLNPEIIKEQGKNLKSVTLDEMNSLWEDSKKYD